MKLCKGWTPGAETAWERLPRSAPIGINQGAEIAWVRLPLILQNKGYRILGCSLQ
jgi:hypothetical protein